MNKENDSRTYAESLLQKYFKTFDYPFTAHQLNSYDQFVANDIPSIIKSSNPILLLEDKIANTDEYAYRIEIYIGGIEGNKFYVGTPTISLKDGNDIRIMYPNEARLRNLTYASNVEADITVKITFTRYNSSGKLESNTVLLSYAPADGLDPAEYIPISDISYLSSVGSSAVRTILSTPSSFTKPLEDIGTRNISKSKFVFVE
jgi:DNA-directed RNA polymerase beta subunit